MIIPLPSEDEENWEKNAQIWKDPALKLFAYVQDGLAARRTLDFGSLNRSLAT
jgi:hypothetical protein